MYNLRRGTKKQVQDLERLLLTHLRGRHILISLPEGRQPLT